MGVARTIPTDVSKESSAYKGELILDQDKKILKFKARDGSIHIIEGASYDLLYEHLAFDNILMGVTEEEITKRINSSEMLNDSICIYDANMNITRMQSNLVEFVGATITIYDKGTDKIMAIMPQVRLEDVFTLYQDEEGSWHNKTLNMILDEFNNNFEDIYSDKLTKFLLSKTYTTDKQTFFTKGAGLDESKYGTAKAITTVLDTLIKNLSDNYIVKGSGYDSAKYPNMKSITDVVDGISSSLTNTGSIGARIKTIEDSYLPKGTYSSYATKYPTIASIAATLNGQETINTNINNNFSNYLPKGASFGSAYPGITSMVDIMQIVTTASNNASIAVQTANTASSAVTNLSNNLNDNYIQKGTGYDSGKYPYLKSITTALDNILSSYLPKGANWSPKYTAVASLYDIMEKISAIETWISVFVPQTQSAFVPFGSMTAADKAEFPDLYSIIDNIRSSDTFIAVHSNSASQVGAHKPVMDEVDVRIASANSLMTSAINALDAKIKVNADNSEIRYIGRSYGEVCGYCPDDYLYPSFNSDMAYGMPAVFGIYGSMKRIRKDITLAIKSIRMTFPGVYPIVTRNIELGNGTLNADINTTYTNKGYVKFKNPSTADTRSNDVRIYLPLYTTGESYNDWSLDFGGNDNIIVIDFIPDKVGHVIIFVCYNKPTSEIEYYTYDILTKVLVKMQTAYAIDGSIDNLDRDFKIVDVTNGGYFHNLNVRASVSARNMTFYLMNRNEGGLQTSYSTSTVTLAPGQTKTLTISVTKNEIPTSGTVTITIPSALTCDEGTTFTVPTSGSKTITLRNTGGQGSYTGALISSGSAVADANTIPVNKAIALQRPVQASLLSVKATDKLIGAGACFDYTKTYESGSFVGRASICAIGIKNNVTTLFLHHYDGVVDDNHSVDTNAYASAHSSEHSVTSPIQIGDGYVPVSVTSESNMNAFNIRFIKTQTNELYIVRLSFDSDSAVVPTVSAASKVGTVFHGDKLSAGYIGDGSGLSIENISIGEYYNTWSIITNKYITGPTSIASYGPNKINDPSKVFLYTFS